jgi:hypothetical protein
MAVHGNEYHDPDFATESALSSHASAATGVHGVGAGTIAKVGDIAVDANLSAAAQDAISKKHTQGTDTALGAVGTKNPPIDADKALYRDSAASDALKTSTWTQIKAFLKTYFDTIYRLATADHTHQSTGAQAGKLDHGLALDGLADDDHPQYIKHSLATAVSDFLVASGAGVFVKKTLAETKSLVAPKQYIPGSNAQSILGHSGSSSSPFSALINGTPSATSVVYDTDTNENFLGAMVWASQTNTKVILWNTTRGTSRVVTAINTTTNTITTESSSDSWANNDAITTQSQTNTAAGYCDIDVSGFLTANSVAIIFAAQILDTASGMYYMQWHPFETYGGMKEVSLVSYTANQFVYVLYIVPVISGKITIKIVASGAATFTEYIKYLGRIDSA